jgi:hypothetical protein
MLASKPKAAAHLYPPKLAALAISCNCSCVRPYLALRVPLQMANVYVRPQQRATKMEAEKVYLAGGATHARV